MLTWRSRQWLLEYSWTDSKTFRPSSPLNHDEVITSTASGACSAICCHPQSQPCESARDASNAAIALHALCSWPRDMNAGATAAAGSGRLTDTGGMEGRPESRYWPVSAATSASWPVHHWEAGRSQIHNCNSALFGACCTCYKLGGALPKGRH